jgi:hypothetical protein
MMGYKIVPLDSFFGSLGEDSTNAVLSSYVCSANTDIEDFLRHKALVFSQQGLAKTHLVFASFRDEYVLVGYYTIAMKTMFIPDRARLSQSLKHRLQKFATRIDETRMTVLSAPLIAQLGKNYANGYDKLITGDELLQMACDTIRSVQLSVGGKVACLESGNIPRLIAFYERNGFMAFDSRTTNAGETLIQMIRYFKG